MTAIAVPGQAITLDKAGLATEAKQDVIIGHIDGVEAALSTRATEATQLLIKAKTDNLDVALSTRATEATQLLVKAKTDNLDVALSTRATETTQQKLREWPYATYDKQKLTQGVLTDTWEYLDGVAVVGTILITYTDATKNTIDNVAYSPDQVV